MDAPGTMTGARLAGLWRYPVKSLQGEELADGIVDDDGLRGDRTWGIRDEMTGRILTARREPSLLLAAASLGDADEPNITLPGGDRLDGAGARTDRALSEWVGKPVTLIAAERSPRGKAEFFADATDDNSQAMEWTMPPGRFVDAMPLLILTTTSLRTAAALHPQGAWETRRFRPNLLVEIDGDGWIEDSWCGRTVKAGPVELTPREPCVRCTMVTRPQPGLDRDVDIFKVLSRHHGGTFGVWTQVRTPGPIRVGDLIDIDP